MASEGQAEPNAGFDAFFAHNSKDKSILDALVRALRGRVPASRIWVDSEQIPFGSKHADLIDRGIKDSNSVAVFLGEVGMGQWENEELHAAISHVITTDKPLFAVFLPGFPDSARSELSLFLSSRRLLDLRPFWVDNQLQDEGVSELIEAVMGLGTSSAIIVAPDADKAVPAPSAADRFVAHAVLVGVSTYDDDEIMNLHGPHNDVRELAEALASMDLGDGIRWNVHSVIDPGSDRIVEELEAIKATLLGPDGLFLFYFSGHGIVQGPSAYLCTKSTQLDTPSTKSLGLNTLVEYVNAYQVGRAVLIFDCCHATPVPAESRWDKELKSPAVAVIGASLGRTRDASRVDQTSPFTRELVRILRGEEHSAQRITAGDLRDQLEGSGCLIWENDSLDRDIVLALDRPRDQLPPRQRSEPVDVIIDPTEVPTDALIAMRMITRLVGELIALADEDSSVDVVLADAVRLLGSALAGSALPSSDRDRLALAVAETGQHSCPGLALRFAGKRSLQSFADVPWELLAFFQDGERSEMPNAFPVAVERVVAASRTKAAGRPEAIVLYREPLGGADETDRQVLARLTQNQLPEETRAVDRAWGTFSASPPRSDVVVLQIPVVATNAGPRFQFLNADLNSTKSVTTKMVADLLRPRVVSYVVIESIADSCGLGTMQATWSAAADLASELEVDVVAVCHPRRLLRLLKIEKSRTFVAELVRLLTLQVPPREAAADARSALLAGLGLDEGSAAGIPVVFHAVEEAPPVGSTPSVSSRTKEREQASAPIRPTDKHSAMS